MRRIPREDHYALMEEMVAEAALRGLTFREAMREACLGWLGRADEVDDPRPVRPVAAGPITERQRAMLGIVRATGTVGASLEDVATGMRVRKTSLAGALRSLEARGLLKRQRTEHKGREGPRFRYIIGA